MQVIFHLFFFAILQHAQDATTTKTSHDDDSYFEHATRSAYFVDKTLLLKDFLNIQPPIITCPKNFGKTTNLDMTRRFFQAPFDPTTGQRLDKTTTRYYQLFTNQTSNLKIIADQSFVQEHLCEHPVIHLNFADIRGNGTEQITNSIMQKIENAFESYRWICDKKDINDQHPNKLKHERIEAVLNKTSDARNILIALQNLIELLDQRYKKTVIVLIDDYDNPTTYAVRNGDDAGHVDAYMHRLLSTFVKNSYLTCNVKVMIVGISRLFMERPGLSDSINTLKHNYFLEHTNHLGKYFGFNESEVDQLLTAGHISEEEGEKLKKFFDGYEFNTDPMRANEPKLYLYNPKGVIQYLETRTIDNQHHPGDLVSSIMKCLRHERFFFQIMQLLKNTTTPLRDSFHMSKADLKIFTDIVKSNCSLDNSTTFKMTPFIDAGYLLPNGNIPNKMAANQLKRKFQDFFVEAYGVNITGSQIMPRLREIMTSHTTSIDMLINLADSLFKLMPRLKPPNNEKYKVPDLDKFQFATVLHGIVNCYTDFAEQIPLQNINSTRQPKPDDYTFLTIPNRGQKILHIIQILYYTDNFDRAFREIRSYAPREPVEESDFNVIKYLIITMNIYNRVSVAPTANRLRW